MPNMKPGDIINIKIDDLHFKKRGDWSDAFKYADFSFKGFGDTIRTIGLPDHVECEVIDSVPLTRAPNTEVI